MSKESGNKDEGDLLLILKGKGLFRAKVHGIYKLGAKLAAWTEPPSLITAELILASKGCQNGRLINASLKSNLAHFRVNYENYAWFSFILVIIKNFLTFDFKYPYLYTLVGETLKNKGNWISEVKIDLAIANFLLGLLKKEGMHPDFSCCQICEKNFSSFETGYFKPGDRGISCQKCCQASITHKTRIDPLISYEYLNLIPEAKPIPPPQGILRINPEVIDIISKWEKSPSLESFYTKIFSSSKIDGRLIKKTRNFLLIFLASLM